MDYKTVLTTCTYCGCGCGFYLEVMDGQGRGYHSLQDESRQRGKALH